MRAKITCGEVRTVDGKGSTLEFIASDETLDSYNEVVKADGWRHTLFQKNAPFADSHNYNSVRNSYGIVTGWEVARKRLLNEVRFATEIPENEGARFAYNMYKGGFLRGVSVGFKPLRSVSRWSTGDEYKKWEKELGKLNIGDGEQQPNRIYLEQEQIELSAVLIGANPNAVLQNTAKAYKQEVIGDSSIDWLADYMATMTKHFAPRTQTDARTAIASEVRASSRRQFTDAFEQQLKSLGKK